MILGWVWTDKGGKNSASCQFGFEQIGHSDKYFTPEPCSDYKSDILTRPVPEPDYLDLNPDLNSDLTHLTLLN